jgi:hypothetical protein
MLTNHERSKTVVSLLSHVLMLVLTQLVCGRPKNSRGFMRRMLAFASPCYSTSIDLFESSLFKWSCHCTLNHICFVYNIELLITDFCMARMRASTSEHFSFVVITESYIFICVLFARRTIEPDLRIRDEILRLTSDRSVLFPFQLYGRSRNEIEKFLF